MKGPRLSVSPFSARQIYSGLPDLNITPQQLTSCFFFFSFLLYDLKLTFEDKGEPKQNRTEGHTARPYR